MQPHPAAEIFPRMTGVDFAALVEDINQNGQREPIVVYNDMILDGRHRYRACQELGREPITSVWDGKGTPEAFVISKNLHRRHLKESQRAMIAKKLAMLKLGDNQHSKEGAPKGACSQEEAAKLLNVSRRAVQRAAVVLEKAEPEMAQAVARGDIPVSTAAQLVDLPKDRQREIASAGKKAAAKVARQVRMRKHPSRSESARHESTRVVLDPEFQAEAEAAARDLEIERDERIATAGAGALDDENRQLKKQVALLDRRTAALQRENQSLKYRE